MFQLKINTDGAAFRDENGNLDLGGREVGLLLAGVIIKLRAGCQSGTLLDSNGNRVGEWEYGD